MDDDRIHGRTEEHELCSARRQATRATAITRRLADLRVILDQCWDLLRGRRALHESGLDEKAARVRDPDVVERYQQ